MDPTPTDPTGDADRCPVIQCDGCGAVTPARLGPRLDAPAVSGAEREADLRAAGWRLTPVQDLCPTCRAAVGAPTG